MERTDKELDNLSVDYLVTAIRTKVKSLESSIDDLEIYRRSSDLLLGLVQNYELRDSLPDGFYDDLNCCDLDQMKELDNIMEITKLEDELEFYKNLLKCATNSLLEYKRKEPPIKEESPPNYRAIIVDD